MIVVKERKERPALGILAQAPGSGEAIHEKTAQQVKQRQMGGKLGG